MKRERVFHHFRPVTYFIFVSSVAAPAATVGVILPFMGSYGVSIMFVVLMLIIPANFVFIQEEGDVLLCIMAGLYAGSVLASVVLAWFFSSWNVLIYNAAILLGIYCVSLVTFLVRLGLGRRGARP